MLVPKFSWHQIWNFCGWELCDQGLWVGNSYTHYLKKDYCMKIRLKEPESLFKVRWNKDLSCLYGIDDPYFSNMVEFCIFAPDSLHVSLIMNWDLFGKLEGDGQMELLLSLFQFLASLLNKVYLTDSVFVYLLYSYTTSTFTTRHFRWFWSPSVYFSTYTNQFSTAWAM